MLHSLITNESVNVADRHGDRALHIAARNGDIQTVQLLVDCGADVNALNEDGQTPLHTAAGGLKDCPELCSILLKHNAKIDAVDRDRNQPLHLACTKCHTKTSCLLLYNYAHSNALNRDGQTPLHTAAGGEEDCPDLCYILLKRNAKIDAVDKDGNQPLHLACSRLHSETCSLLVSHGVSTTSLNKQQKQPVVLANESVMMKFKVDNSNHALHIASRNGDTQTVQLLVDCGADVNVLNGDGQTPLHTAADGKKDCPKLCFILLKHNAKIDAVDKDGNQPLHLAWKRGHTKTSHLLLSNGADVNALNEDGQTLLHTAAGGWKDYPELCSILLKHNAKIDAVDKDGNQPLHLAWKRGHTKTSRLLLSNGADVNALNEDGQTLLHTAAGGKKDCSKLCSILLKHNAKIDAVDKDGNQPLHLAWKRGHTKTSHLLLSNGADVNALNEDGQTLLHTAAGGWKDYPELCSILLKHNAKIDAVDKDGNQPLHLAWKRGHTKTSHLLLSNGADVNALNEDGQTLLHTAAGGWKDYPELCSILLKHNAKIDAVDKDGNQPLHLACKRGHTRTSRLLLSNGADVNAFNEDGQTLLHTAAGRWEDCHELCSILLKHNAKIDAVDKDGNQPLHLAWKRGHTKTSHLLLSNGADVNALNEDGQTLLHTAAGGWEDCPELCSILLKHNAKIDAVGKDGNQSLHLAWKRGHTKTSRLLLSNGADVNALNEDGQTLLHTAAGGWKDYPELCSILLEHNAKIDAVDKDGNQPLHLACEAASKSTVQHLLDCNADVLATNNSHQTALHKAACSKRDCPEVCVMLIAKGAQVNDTDGNGDTSLHVAFQKRKMNTVNVLCDADCNVVNVCGETLLHLACKSRVECVELCDKLISHGVNPHIADREGNLPLHVALKNKLPKTFGCLFQKSGKAILDDLQVTIDKEDLVNIFSSAHEANDINTCGRIIEFSAKLDPSNRLSLRVLNCHTTIGYLLIQRAVKEKNITFCQHLIDHGASVNADVPHSYRDRTFKDPPLHLAVKLGHTDLCRLLLEHGATIDPEMKGSIGPLHLAVVNEQKDVARLLLSHGADLSKVEIGGESALKRSEKRGNVKMASIIQATGE